MPLLTVQQVAEHLAVSRQTVYSLINSGQLQARRVMGCYRVRAEDLEEYEEAIGTRRPTPVKESAAKRRRERPRVEYWPE